jgi:hypothetical protein
MKSNPHRRAPPFRQFRVMLRLRRVGRDILVGLPSIWAAVGRKGTCNSSEIDLLTVPLLRSR